MTFALWMTGLPCSGKTTIAKRLIKSIPNLAVLDGDELREWLSPKDFSREGRNEHNKKVAYLTKLLISHKVPVCVSLISPYYENRETAKKIVGKDFFIELYVKCSLNECEKRDVKGMYKKARNNELKSFTGISDNYDIPKNPDLVVNTEEETLESVTKKILEYLKKRNFL